jgi:hypothetical protein
MPWPAKTTRPSENVPNDPASPTVNATRANTAALTASTMIRCGAAAGVERIYSVAYSPVITSTPSTTMAS